MKLTSITNPVALRRDTTVGTRIFAGDTMIYGDTGARDIDKDNIKSGRICLFRYGPLVSIHFDSVIFNNAPGNVFLTRLPLAYRPLSDVRFPLYATGVPSTSASSNVSSAGYLNVYGTSTDTPLSGQATFITSYGWPTTLPGLPV